MNWFKQDKIANGFIAALLLTLITAFAIFILLKIFGADILVNVKIFLFSCVSEILLLRWYAHKQQQRSSKGAVLSLIVTLIGIIVFLLKYHII